MAEEENFPIKLLQSNRASARYGRLRVQNYVPFFFSALFSFSTSEVPGSPPSTSLARQVLGHRCQARIASATLFRFGGVDDAPIDDTYRRTGAFFAFVPWADALNHSPGADGRSVLASTVDSNGVQCAALRASGPARDRASPRARGSGVRGSGLTESLRKWLLPSQSRANPEPRDLSNRFPEARERSRASGPR